MSIIYIIMILLLVVFSLLVIGFTMYFIIKEIKFLINRRKNWQYSNSIIEKYVKKYEPNVLTDIMKAFNIETLNERLLYWIIFATIVMINSAIITFLIISGIYHAVFYDIYFLFFN